MNIEERRSMGIPCDVCGENGASEIVGGILLNGFRNQWLVCKECKKKIIDERKSKRN